MEPDEEAHSIHPEHVPKGDNGAQQPFITAGKGGDNDRAGNGDDHKGQHERPDRSHPAIEERQQQNRDQKVHDPEEADAFAPHEHRPPDSGGTKARQDEEIDRHGRELRTPGRGSNHIDR
jgi:hypothetical protein